METTLILSRSYQPLYTLNWQDAVSLLFTGRVEVVEEYDREIRSTYLCIKLPAVMRFLKSFRRKKKPVKFSRHNIMARDGWKCQYCGIKVNGQTMTMDHVVPRSQGGITRWSNIVAACSPCNAKKDNRTPQQAGMKIKKQPKRPNWVPLYSVRLSGSPPDQWASYLYWTSELES